MAAILRHLCLDTEEDRIVACKQLSQRCLYEGESVNELARDIEKFLEQASPGLPTEIKDFKLHFHFINFSLPEIMLLQLKLQPKVSYVETIAKAREVRLIYRRSEGHECVNEVQDDS